MRCLKPLSKTIFQFLISILVILDLSSCLSNAQNISSRSRIGFVLPLSGEWSFLGKGIQNAAILAQEDLSPKLRPELIFEDNGGELIKSASITSRLIDVRKVNAIISIISGVAQVIKPIAERKGVILIGICSDTSVANGKLSFINYLTAEQGVQSYLNYLTSKKAAPISISIIHMNESGFTRIADLLKQLAPDKEIKVKIVESFDKGTTDFRSMLLKIGRDGQTTVALLGLSPEIELLARQAKELNLDLHFSSIESFGLIGDKSMFEGDWFVDSAYPSDEFVSRYEKRFGTEVTQGVGHAYESVKLLAESFSTSEPIKSFQNSRNINGVLGELSVGTNGVIITQPSVKVVINGRPVTR